MVVQIFDAFRHAIRFEIGTMGKKAQRIIDQPAGDQPSLFRALDRDGDVCFTSRQ
ncbi:hypothetical protein D3C87_1796260 [compost metagenome]